VYNKGMRSVITSGTVTATGAVILPNTGGNTLGTFLAYAAITIGSTALISQLTVRIVRRVYHV